MAFSLWGRQLYVSVVRYREKILIFIDRILTGTPLSFILAPLTRTMKTQSSILLAVLFFSLSTFVVGSCKKHEEPAKSTNTVPGIYMKMDGADLAFPDADRATRNEMNDVFSLTISAAKLPQEISITLFSDQWNFDAGKVYNYEVPEFAEAFNQLGYCPDTNVFDDCYDTQGPSGQERQLTVLITESNAEFVKGTFSGSVFLRTGTEKKAVITDGRFYVRYLP